MQTSSWPVLHRAVRAALAAAGSVTFAILLLSLAHVDGVPVFLLAALACLAAVAARRPGAALLLLAAAIPVAAWTGRTWHGGVAWPETLAVAFAAGYLARPLWSPPRTRDGLHLPIAAFSAVVLASLAVRLLVLHWTIGGEALWLQIRGLALGGYFIGNGGFRELDAAMRLLEGLVLLRAAATASAGSRAFAPRLVRWFVIGAAAAAALNLWRIWQGALRTESPVSTFFEYLMTLRYNVHYGDVNAAGSYFVMALLVAVGLALATRRASWIAAAALIASSLMLSGSRSALAAGGGAGLAWVSLATARGRGVRFSPALSAAALVIVAAAAAAALILISARSVATPSLALQIRTELARTTMGMLAEHPVFGIGIGQYQELSVTYGAPMLIQTFRVQNENAHNNFLQVLGELGVSGLAAFLWVLGTAGAALARQVRDSRTVLPAATAAGLLAFVLTWLAGHPLLTDEPALLFWLLLGTAGGWSPPPGSDASGRKRAAAAGLALLLIVASIPLRALSARAEADLEHRGIGLSVWRPGPDGVRHRLAGARSTVFVPADALLVAIPLRSADPATERRVSISLNGRPANVVRVPGDRWYILQLALTADPEAPRFHRLDLEVQQASGGVVPGALLMVGKVEPR